MSFDCVYLCLIITFIVDLAAWLSAFFAAASFRSEANLDGDRRARVIL